MPTSRRPPGTAADPLSPPEESSRDCEPEPSRDCDSDGRRAALDADRRGDVHPALDPALPARRDPDGRPPALPRGGGAGAERRGPPERPPPRPPPPRAPPRV